MRITRIARAEWQSLFRDKVAVFGLALLTLLTLIAALTAYEHQRHANAQRAHYQAQATHEFENQPDRHPHRVAHFGHFLFRPLNPLAAFDPGIDPYTGHTLFLEAHRQNSANFADARQSSLLLRFGQLTPAFVLQVLAPLLLVFVGHAVIARERESGTLRVLLAQGVRSLDVMTGKWLALAGFAFLTGLPAALALLWWRVSGQVEPAPTLLLLAGYALWLGLWPLLVVLVSAWCARGRDALLAALAVWAVLVILLPRVVPDVANTAIPLPTRFETAINVERDFQALGDPHNPDDPAFTAFRNQVLAQYGVSRIEDLPVNFKGLVGMEGERQSSALFNRYAAAAFARQQQQNQVIDRAAWFSPLLALRRLSMAAARTDLAHFQHFLDQGEAYRYALVQGLNRLQAEAMTREQDQGSTSRISRDHWQQFPPFAYIPRGRPRAHRPAAHVDFAAMAGRARCTRMANKRAPDPGDAMTWLAHELRLVARSKLSLVTLLLMLALSALSVWSGQHEIRRQQQTIEHLAPLNAADAEATFDNHAADGDPGNLAYYTFFNTWDAPLDSAFLALGLRDIAPYVLRVRALGLQAQLYEGETFNPELALPGRFDFAFVLIYLAPLFVIALLHDLVSGERQAGRWQWLMSLPQGPHVWQRRAGLRYMLMLMALALPVLVGAWIAGTRAGAVAVVLLLTASYLAFWVGVCLIIARRGWRSSANATALMGTWALLTLILPTLANIALTRAIPVNQGVDLMLAQREAVHGAWEIPRETTMQRFFVHHPEWKDTAPLPEGFHWKWYLAFHQLGDESVAAEVSAYRAGLLARHTWTTRLGWLLPGVGAQALIHRVAATDLQAQLAYQDEIIDFHRQIRAFFYPYLFNDAPVTRADFSHRPQFEPRVETTSLDAHIWLVLLLPWLVGWYGMVRIERLRSPSG